MKKILLIAGVALTLASCKSADNQLPQIATDMCQCFAPLDKLKPETKALINDALTQPNFTTALQAKMTALPQDQQMIVAQDMGTLAGIDAPGSESSVCIKNLETKYKDTYTKDKEGLLQKLMVEMRKKGGTCSMAAGFMEIGLKQNGTIK